MNTRPYLSSIPRPICAHYLDHPAHAELGKMLFDSAEAVLAYDFLEERPMDLR